ncbi:hypothetical protein ACWV95_21940 [Streptomyces albus]
MCATYATNAALALVLAGALTGCTGSSGSDGDDDGKPGGSSASPTAAEPGKYRTLPKPCDVVPVSTLRQMLRAPPRPRRTAAPPRMRTAAPSRASRARPTTPTGGSAAAGRTPPRSAPAI